jgi:aspartate aminotransferase
MPLAGHSTMNYENSIIRQVKPSPSMAISLQARKMTAEGRPVIDLSLGEPDFNTPDHIIEAAYAAARAGQTRYTAADGTPELKKAIAEKFARENGLDYKPTEISVANGAKQIIFNALMVTLEEGDEVLVPAPYWVSYTDMVLLMRGVPKVVACTAETGFKITPQVLRASLTPKTRWLILNAPSNPSGAIYDEAELKALGGVLADFPNVLVMSDEIYEHILYDGRRFTSFAKACPELRDRTLIVNGVSKAYAMTGWRIGYAAGPEGLIKAVAKFEQPLVGLAGRSPGGFDRSAGFRRQGGCGIRKTPRSGRGRAGCRARPADRSPRGRILRLRRRLRPDREVDTSREADRK